MKPRYNTPEGIERREHHRWKSTVSGIGGFKGFSAFSVFSLEKKKEGEKAVKQAE